MTVRTQAVIRLDALRHNVENVRNRLHKGCQLMAVLKGDGYGHGIAGIYETLRASGVERYAVAVWEEGALLRSLGATEPILILGDTCDDCLPELLKHNLIPAIFCVETAAKLNALAKSAGVRHPIHIKLEAPHPSPLSAYNGFFGSRPFSRVNAFLESNGIAPIDWRIE